jgi:hypothetical protein
MGTNRKVKARPTSRFWPVRIGFDPRIQTFLRPFFRRMVVIVAVVTALSVATTWGSRGSGATVMGCPKEVMAVVAAELARTGLLLSLCAKNAIRFVGILSCMRRSSARRMEQLDGLVANRT